MENNYFKKWRDKKLSFYPAKLSDLVVEVRDCYNLSPAEFEAINIRVSKYNMAIYHFQNDLSGFCKKELREFAAKFGLINIDKTLLTDDEAVTSIEEKNIKPFKRYIPYTNFKMSWHSDGYYNHMNEQIKGFLLHCVRPAFKGGYSEFIDPDIAYILLREHDEELAKKLFCEDVLIIPENRFDDRVLRAESVGPVFSFHYNDYDISPDFIHMRYSDRKREIVWKNDEKVLKSIKFLKDMMEGESIYKFKGKLQSGQGLIANNVLHKRSAFENHNQNDVVSKTFNDSSAKELASSNKMPIKVDSGRLLWRVRYYDRIKDSNISNLLKL